jgi:hypothetical protein
MVLIACLVVFAMALSWKPVRRLIPSESLVAVALIAVALLTLLGIGQAG